MVERSVWDREVASSTLAIPTYMYDYQSYKQKIDQYLHAFLISKRKDLLHIHKDGEDVINKILSIISEGKTIRGSLVLFTHDVLKGNRKKEAMREAAAFELIQTGFLVHDDIIDHEEIRRGHPCLHIQYKNEGKAICAGDLLFFLAFELLKASPIQEISNNIFEEVTAAQIVDITYSMQQTQPTQKEIISLYKYKTARYSFSLPMMAGAMLAKADMTTIHLLELLGESMGIIFQIKNDIKGTISDKREDKKTLIRFYDVQPIITMYARYVNNYIKKLPQDFSQLLMFL